MGWGTICMSNSRAVVKTSKYLSVLEHHTPMYRSLFGSIKGIQEEQNVFLSELKPMSPCVGISNKIDDVTIDLQ